MTQLERQPTQPTDLVALRDRLRTLPAQKRIEALLDRPDILRVVRSLPVQDLYATLRDVGVTDCLEVLELCSPRQVQAFLDLDGWRGDRLDAVSVTSWLQALFAASPDRAVTQIRGLDIELITLLFKEYAKIYDLSAEEEPEEEPGLHTITPDRRYLIAFGGPDGDDALPLVLKELIERLMGRDNLFVLRLCEAVRWELPSSLEEESLRWRNGRLADLGFVPYHDALAIFAYVDPDKFLDDKPGLFERPSPAAADVEGEPVSDLSTSVLLPWDVLNDGSTALGRALHALPEAIRARICHELMMVGNQVHAADNGDAGNPEAVRATVRRVAETVGIALTYLARGDAAKLAAPLARVPAMKLFQVGHSLGLRLGRELRARIASRESGLSGNGLLRLDTPLRELAAGLLRRQPVLYAGLLDRDRVDYRPFTSLVEVAAAAKATAEAAFRAEVLGPRGLGVTDERLAELGAADTATQPSHASILGAALARVVNDEALRVGPVDAATVAALRARLLSSDADVQIERTLATWATAARTCAPLAGAATADAAAARARTYGAQVLSAVRAELLALTDERPDPRFLTSLWTAHP